MAKHSSTHYNDRAIVGWTKGHECYDILDCKRWRAYKGWYFCKSISINHPSHPIVVSITTFLLHNKCHDTVAQNNICGLWGLWTYYFMHHVIFPLFQNLWGLTFDVCGSQSILGAIMLLLSYCFTHTHSLSLFFCYKNNVF